MLLKVFKMSQLCILKLVCLMCAFSTVIEFTVGEEATSKTHCSYRNTCKRLCCEIHKAMHELHHGAQLSHCGKLPFNHLSATCCKAGNKTELTEGLSEKVSACCGLKAYDKLNQICCNSTIIAKPTPNAQCCDNQVIDGHKQLCCGPLGNKTVLKKKSIYHQCCGKDQFNTSSQFCCQMNEGLQIRNSSCSENKSEGLSEKVSACCGLKAYDKLNQICCNSTIIAKPTPNAQCCDNQVIDGHKQLCCGPLGNKTVLKKKSIHHQCCGKDQFNTSSQSCCVIDKSLQIRNSCSCENESAEFDGQNQLWCGPFGNRTVLNKKSIHHQCCGKDQFDTSSQSCCLIDESLQIRNSCSCENESEGLSEKVSACCGLKAYDKLNQICCNSTIIAKPTPNAQCCDNQVIDGHKQLCCGPLGNKTVLKKKSIHHQCCGKDQFNTSSQSCCVIDKSLQIRNSCSCENESANSGSEARYPVIKCNGKEFDGNTQLCCGPLGNKTVLNKKSIDHQCCGKDQFNTSSQSCCVIDETLQIRNSCSCENESGVQQQKPASSSMQSDPHTHLSRSSGYHQNKCHRCGRKHSGSGQCESSTILYKPQTPVCCDGCVSERKQWIDQCCREMAYGMAQHGVFCCKNSLYTDGDDEGECSGASIPYNSATVTICCSQFNGSLGQHCCGTEIFKPETEICCNGHRHPKEKHVHCCGTDAYNIKDPRKKCCSGTLHNVTSNGHDVECCGSILQKKQDKVCCSSENLHLPYSAKTGFQCCGHQYYNTSLWSCCAGKIHSIHHHGSSKCIKKPRFLSMNNLNETELCQEIKIGTVEGVSPQSIVFNSVLKIHGRNATVVALPLHYILKIPDCCNFAKLTVGNTYFFNEVNILIDSNHHTFLQSLHFIFSKCYHH